jgi:hypothetical protein
MSNAYQSNRSSHCISLKSWILSVKEKMHHSPHTKLINIGSKAIWTTYNPMYVVYLIPGLGLFMWWIWCEIMWNNVMSGGNHKKQNILKRFFSLNFFDGCRRERVCVVRHSSLSIHYLFTVISKVHGHGQYWMNERGFNFGWFDLLATEQSAWQRDTQIHVVVQEWPHLGMK